MHISESDATTTCDFVSPGAKQAIALQHKGTSKQFDILLSSYYVTCGWDIDAWYVL